MDPYSFDGERRQKWWEYFEQSSLREPLPVAAVAAAAAAAAAAQRTMAQWEKRLEVIAEMVAAG
jgi:hypothetical protein